MSPIPPVVDAGWLEAHLTDVVVADVRWYVDGRSGRSAWLGGHLPGAVWVDVDADLSAPGAPTEGRHPFPSPDGFARAMGRVGVGDGEVVVAYDDTGGSTAARLVWMLRAVGHPAALLDGGIAAWPGPLEEGEVERPSRSFTARRWPEALLANADDVGDAASGGGAVVDARAAGRYTGELLVALDPRPGHVPGARSAPWQGNLGDDGRFLDAEALRARYAGLGVTEPGAIASCGSGVTACHDLLALERAGLPGRLYVASWSGWAADPDRPAATGPEPA